MCSPEVTNLLRAVLLEEALRRLLDYTCQNRACVCDELPDTMRAKGEVCTPCFARAALALKGDAS